MSDAPDNPMSTSADNMSAEDLAAHEAASMSKFEKELEHLINCHSLENGSDTPDFMLAEYLRGCLENFNRVVRKRSIWYGTATKTVGELSKKLGLTGELKEGPQT
jgi:hypothetical protein